MAIVSHVLTRSRRTRLKTRPWQRCDATTRAKAEAAAAVAAEVYSHVRPLALSPSEGVRARKYKTYPTSMPADVPAT